MGIPKTETIAAIATPPGVGGIGIVRISGPLAFTVLQTLFRPYKPRDVFQSHRMYYGTLIDRNNIVLDEVLAVYMRAPHTYTTEDVVELHSHGSYLVLESVLAAVFSTGVRPAEPGEFTKRAFLGGRIDLTRAEAVIDVLKAETEKGVRLAVDQMQGAMYEEVDRIRKGLVNVLAILEVAIDFPDDDVEIIDGAHLLERLKSEVTGPLQSLLALADQGRMIREGIKAVIIGRPNVGKSSLLNGLLREERALVTNIPGTTRDTIEELIAVRGIPVHLIDTAGIRDHSDQVEELGIARAQQKLAEADLVLFMIDASCEYTDEDRLLYEAVQRKRHIVICNKMDIADPLQVEEHSARFQGKSFVKITAAQKSGLEEVQDAIYAMATGSKDGTLVEQPACAPNVRHRLALEQASQACCRVAEALGSGLFVDLVAVELQAALGYLEEIVGLTTPDEVLDTIFSNFCIGK